LSDHFFFRGQNIGAIAMNTTWFSTRLSLLKSSLCWFRQIVL